MAKKNKTLNLEEEVIEKLVSWAKENSMSHNAACTLAISLLVEHGTSASTSTITSSSINVQAQLESQVQAQIVAYLEKHSPAKMPAEAQADVIAQLQVLFSDRFEVEIESLKGKVREFLKKEADKLKEWVRDEAPKFTLEGPGSQIIQSELDDIQEKLKDVRFLREAHYRHDGQLVQVEKRLDALDAPAIATVVPAATLPVPPKQDEFGFDVPGQYNGDIPESESLNHYEM